MDYTTNLLTNRTDCETLISITTLDKEVLSHRKKGLELNRSSSGKNAVDVQAELASVSAEMAALVSILAGLPEGPVKEEMEIKFKRLDLKKSTLEKRKESYGVLALLEKEYDIACLGKDIEEAEAFITAVKDRMDSL